MSNPKAGIVLFRRKGSADRHISIGVIVNNVIIDTIGEIRGVDEDDEIEFRPLTLREEEDIVEKIGGNPSRNWFVHKPK
jgi:hypothetical protein